MEPTPADQSRGRIPPRTASPQPDQSAARAAAFRRTLDEQTTSHDETAVLPPVPGGPTGSAVPAVIPPVPDPARPRSVRLIDAERRDRQRPGRPGTAGPQPPAGPNGYGAGAGAGANAGPGTVPGAPPVRLQPTQLPPTQFQPTQVPPAPARRSPDQGSSGQGSTSAAAAAFEQSRTVAAVPPRAPARPGESAYDLAVSAARVLAATEDGPSRDPARSGGRGGALATAGSGSGRSGGRTRHSAGNRPARLPAVIGVCAALTMIGGLVLILTNGGLSPAPTAPAALPGTPQQIVIAGNTGAGSVGDTDPQPSPSAVRSSSPPVRATDPATGASVSAPPSTRAPAPPPPTHAGPTPSPSTTFQPLSQGSTGALVAQLQGKLQQSGYLVKSPSRGYGSVCQRNGWDASGTDETQTTDAIYQFQRNYDDFAGGKLQTNGICDYATWQALFANPVAARDCYDGV